MLRSRRMLRRMRDPQFESTCVLCVLRTPKMKPMKNLG